MSLADHKVVFFDILVKSALPVTLQLIAGAFVGACLIGLIGGIIRGLKVPVLSQILGVYVQICRGVPDMLVLLFLYAVMTRGSTYSIAVLGISLIQGAYIMEIIKGCQNALPAYPDHFVPHCDSSGHARCPSGIDRATCPFDQRNFRCIHHRMYGDDEACNDRNVRFFKCSGRIRLRFDHLLHYVPCIDRIGQETGKICSRKDYW